MGLSVIRTNTRSAVSNMIFEPLKLAGAYLIKPEKNEDQRGFFARSFCKQEFQNQGLISEFVQCNISYNKRKGTLRGMHYQLPPHQETKLVRCSRGAIYDVIIDIRKASATYKKWLAFELTSINSHILYIPEGFAHGFLTLENDSEIFYQMSTYYKKNVAVGFRWNDATFKIKFPQYPEIISDKDQEYADFLC